MRLADDDIHVMIGSERLALRPSLRAATRIERLCEGNFQALFDKLITGHLGSLVGVLCAASIDPIQPETVHAALRGKPLASQLAKLKSATVGLFPGLTFSKPAPAGENPSEANPIPFASYYARLYRIGTGILRWPPHVVWDSTPAEIIEAFSGYGGILDDELVNSPLHNTRLDRAGLDSLRGRGRLR